MVMVAAEDARRIKLCDFQRIVCLIEILVLIVVTGSMSTAVLTMMLSVKSQEQQNNSIRLDFTKLFIFSSPFWEAWHHRILRRDSTCMYVRSTPYYTVREDLLIPA